MFHQPYYNPKDAFHCSQLERISLLLQSSSSGNVSAWQTKEPTAPRDLPAQALRRHQQTTSPPAEKKRSKLPVQGSSPKPRSLSSLFGELSPAQQPSQQLLLNAASSHTVGGVGPQAEPAEGRGRAGAGAGARLPHRICYHRPCEGGSSPRAVPRAGRGEAAPEGAPERCGGEGDPGGW